MAKSPLCSTEFSQHQRRRWSEKVRKVWRTDSTLHTRHKRHHKNQPEITSGWWHLLSNSFDDLKKRQDIIGITKHSIVGGGGLQHKMLHFCKAGATIKDYKTESQCNTGVIYRDTAVIVISSQWSAVRYLAICKHLKDSLLTSSCTKASESSYIYIWTIQWINRLNFFTQSCIILMFTY